MNRVRVPDRPQLLKPRELRSWLVKLAQLMRDDVNGRQVVAQALDEAAEGLESSTATWLYRGWGNRLRELLERLRGVLALLLAAVLIALLTGAFVRCCELGYGWGKALLGGAS